MNGTGELREEQIQDIMEFAKLFENEEGLTNVTDMISHLRRAKEVNTEVLIKILSNVKKRNRSAGNIISHEESTIPRTTDPRAHPLGL